ncbi:MAG: Hsp70 family protein [Candidatus Delongbacteria bacterium]
MKLIGIDLGTTNSAIAMVNEFGKAEIIPNKEGERITPSVVLFDDEQIIVGSIAKQSSVAEPERTVSSIKSHMGSADYVFEHKHAEYKPEDISAMILRKLVEDAENYLNEKITDVVITVPAYFNDNQRKATIDAGKISGVNVTQIINEPTAAALTYGLDKDINQKILVYDLGGGTFDVTIMNLSKGNFEVVSSDGDRQLGGNNFDEKLMIYLNDKFKQQHDTDLFEDPVLIQDLRLKAENAKKVLSSKLSTTVYMSAKGKSARITVTRKLFSDLVADFVTRTELLMNAVMTDAGLEWDNIDQILLVGGSTRIPAVCDMIFRITGKKPATQINPDEAVALGAAIQAGIVSAKDQNENVNDMVRMKYGAMNVSDVTAHSFGAITLDEFDNKRNAIIIPKNSKIPVRKSQIFYTSSANQTQVKMVVIQGEDPDPEFCTTIGTTTLDFPPKAENSPIIFNYEYDVNGIIHATAKDPDTGKKSEIQIAREGALTNDEIGKKKKDLNSMFPRRREYATRESFAEENTDDASAPKSGEKNDTGASLVSDVFVSSGVSENESFVEKPVFKPRGKDNEDDDSILERSEMETVTSESLKKELEDDSAVAENDIVQKPSYDEVEENEDNDTIENSKFIDRFDEREPGDDMGSESRTDDVPDHDQSAADEDSQIERIDDEIDDMFEEEEDTVAEKVSDSSDSFDEALDQIAGREEEKNGTEEENNLQETETETAEEDENEDLDVFDMLSEAKSPQDEHTEEEKDLSDVTSDDIEKKEDMDDLENVSMEDSSITESQSFDDELDEIGKSEFIIDRSEYLTDEDIIRIKEEGNIKSGMQPSDSKNDQEESFTENEVNELFSSYDSKKIDEEDRDSEPSLENDDKTKNKEKKTGSGESAEDESISDWIDE